MEAAKLQVRKYSILLLLLVATVILGATGQLYRFMSPAATGMKSYVDFELLQPTDAYYAANIRVGEPQGTVQGRRGLSSRGANVVNIYGAIAMYDVSRGWKAFLGSVVMDSLGDTLGAGWIPTYYATGDSFGGSMRQYIPRDTVSKRLGYVEISDTFDLRIRPGDSAYIGVVDSGREAALARFTSVRTANSFVSDDRVTLTTHGTGPPMAITMKKGIQMSTDTLRDTTTFGPRAMANIPPGGLYAQVIDVDHLTTIKSPVQYAYAYGYYYDNNTSMFVIASAHGDIGPASNVVFPIDKAVMLTGFLPPSFKSELGYSLTDSTFFPLYIYRRKLDADGAIGPWMLNNTITTGPWIRRDSAASILYIDSVGQELSVYVDAPGWDSIPTPGTVSLINDILDTVHLNGFSRNGYQANYSFRYSFYDPITGIETPLGPTNTFFNLNVDGVDTFGIAISFGNITPLYTPFRWIRLYRSVRDTLLAGGTDHDVFYGMVEISLENNNDDGMRGINIMSGWLSDQAMAAGSLFTDLGFDSISKIGFNDDNMVVGDDGEVITRPPYLSGMDIVFSDLAYANLRAWGIGDPIFPQRLYYSAYDAIWEWPVSNYFPLGEGSIDEIVAVRSIQTLSGEALYALLHNSIYVTTGIDPASDMTLTRLYTDLGAVSSATTISTGSAVLFLSPDRKIYALSGYDRRTDWTGKGLEPISRGIENWIDSLYPTYQIALDHGVAIELDDRVVWFNDSTFLALAYQISTTTWSMETYKAGFAPKGSFKYDTTRGRSGVDEHGFYVYRSDSGVPLRQENDYVADSSNSAEDAYSIIYQTPFIGDGVGIHEIGTVQLTAKGKSAEIMELFVIDYKHDTLATDTITFDGTLRDYTIGLPRHSGKYLSVRFVGGLETIIHDVILRPSILAKPVIK